MHVLSRFWQSTIGKKIVMAVTGIIGILFVIGHMSGNLLMFKGQEAMHQYALLLRTSVPLLWAVRIGLLAAVVLHVLAAYQLTMRSRAARPQEYAERRPQVTTFAARTIRWGGVLLLVFIVLHLLQLTVGVIHPDFTDLDPYTNVRVALSNPLVAAFYLLAMAALGLHLYHGSWAVVRTLGVARPSAHPLKRRIALAVAIIVAAGFMIIPIAAVLGKFAPAPPLAESSAATALATPAAETH
ncbi:succinate dehydrogenase cytochrome b subunit [Gemmatimonas sp.]|uniref:succinate dehydrogenase cytochrome b subunit n=1 Tax=Gemmatimonas sp. TaxID=1962908 RepID=UPI00398332F7